MRLSGYFLVSVLTAAVLVLPAWTQQQDGPIAQTPAEAALPSKFDLRVLNAVTPIKKQIGGTCWAFGTTAAIESNLLISRTWKLMGMTGLPMCSEYHLDWWNGFNKLHNEDVTDPSKLFTGLTVHQGGEYKVAAAYISRGDGIVIIPEGVDATAWSRDTPPKNDSSFQKLYVRDIEFFTMGDHLEGIDVIKRQIMQYGGVATANKHGSNKSDDIHYQAIDSKGEPNHSTCIIGWDDNKISSKPNADPNKRPPAPGAWLIKNSHGDKVAEAGYHWISYYDKHCCRNPEMGAVAFRNIEPLQYDQIYYHDAHGWRDTLPQISKAFNAFKATDNERIRAVSFYTATHNVDYTIEIYLRFENGKLNGKLHSQQGKSEFCGFHTVDLSEPVLLHVNDSFYVCVTYSTGGHAIDRTSFVNVLLDQEQTQQPPTKIDQPPAKPPQQVPQPPNKDGQKKSAGPGVSTLSKPVVVSKANPGESFFWDGYDWRDLYDYPFVNPDWAVRANVNLNHTANFCMKALTVKAAQ